MTGAGGPDDVLWQRLASYCPGPAGAALSFAQRLARENGWRAAHAARVIEEYRRFCYLAMTAGHPVTPSDAVDQAWHLHLTYSRDYWERFCPEVLGRALHHGPTAGGADERRRYYLQYADTLAAYEAVFGSPPADIWPPARQRLYQDPLARRVHLRDHVILPRPVALLVVLSALMLGVAISLAIRGR
jgi:hypothetical protein